MNILVARVVLPSPSSLDVTPLRTVRAEVEVRVGLDERVWADRIVCSGYGLTSRIYTVLVCPFFSLDAGAGKVLLWRPEFVPRNGT